MRRAAQSFLDNSVAVDFGKVLDAMRQDGEDEDADLDAAGRRRPAGDEPRAVKRAAAAPAAAHASVRNAASQRTEGGYYYSSDEVEEAHERPLPPGEAPTTGQLDDDAATKQWQTRLSRLSKIGSFHI